MLLTAYFTVAIATTALVFLASKRLGDDRRPPTHRFALSVAAGVVWPVMLLGLVEFSSIVACGKVLEHADTGQDSEHDIEQRVAVLV